MTEHAEIRISRRETLAVIAAVTLRGRAVAQFAPAEKSDSDLKVIFFCFDFAIGPRCGEQHAHDTEFRSVDAPADKFRMLYRVGEGPERCLSAQLPYADDQMRIHFDRPRSQVVIDWQPQRRNG